MPPPTGVKLRDSCHLCAVSKVKCSKEKPVCTRCAERGTLCQYLVTQRTGRKARRQNSLEDSRPRTWDSAAPLSLPFLPTLPSPSSPRDDTGVSSSWHGSSLDFGASLGDFIASWATCPELSLSDTTRPHGQQDAGLDCVPEAYLTSGHDMTTQFDPSFSPGGGSSSSTDSNSAHMDLGLENDMLPVQQPRLEATPAQCLGTAIRLMSQLSLVDESHPSPKPGVAFGLPPAKNAAAGLDAIMQDNKDAVYAIEGMLTSDGIQDGYWLVMIALVVSRILDRYAAAVRVLPSGDPDELAMLGGGHSSIRPPLRADGPKPQTVQRVLGELYQVQGLMDRFSSKIEACVSGNHRSLTWSPFSAAVLGQIEAELRKRLSGLSLDLIDRLKQYWG